MFCDSSAYLMHFGRKGQKWGERNGPPYPLNFDDLSPEERAKAKQESIDKGDTVTAQANIKYYSAKEIDDLILKSNKNKQLASINGTDISKGEKFVKKFVKGADMYVDVVDRGSKIYNVTAKVTNAFGLTDLTLIGDKRESAQEKQLRQLRFKKDMMQVQNDIKAAEQRKDELAGKSKDKYEEKLKELRRQADELEQRSKISSYEKTIRDNNKPKENKPIDKELVDLKRQAQIMKEKANIAKSEKDIRDSAPKGKKDDEKKKQGGK